MTYGIYCIRDRLAGFGSPYPHRSQDTAKRSFARIVNNSEGDIAFSPADYDLYLVGDFDDDSGLVTAVIPVQYICNGSDLVGVVKYEKS